MKSISIKVAAIIAVILTSAASVKAATLDFQNLSLAQGFDLNKRVQHPFGHVMSLKIGSTVIPADLDAINPATNRKDGIVGALSSYSWSGGVSDPMKFTFHVSMANKKLLKEILKPMPPGSKVEVNFQIYSYDSIEASYFITLKSFTFRKRGILNAIGAEMPSMKNVSLPIQGALQRGGASITVDDAPGTEVAKPANFAVHMILIPPGASAQDLVRVTSPGMIEKISWGN